MNNNEIVIYKLDELSEKLEVRLEDETIWLTQLQIIDLFNSSKANISEHISHIFETKEYLLKGHAINNRINTIEQKLTEHDKKFDLILNTNLPPQEGVFYDGQIFDAYVFISQIIKSANKSIVLIDNYVDESVLLLLSKRNKNVKSKIFTSKLSKQFQLDIVKHNSQYPEIEIQIYMNSHDRFLIIDHKDVYHIGASLKDLGKKWFAFSRINLDIDEMINKLNISSQ